MPAPAGCGGATNVEMPASEGMSPAALIDEIRQEWRDRQAWRRAEKSLLLQAKARCRALAPDGDKVEAGRIYKAAIGKGEHPIAVPALARIAPLERARSLVEADCKTVEKRLVALAGSLPVASFVEGTRGVGLLSLAGIVGEAGDLSDYATHQRLWKRMGLAVMGDGMRQRRVSGADALTHGYSPGRRSVMWNVGCCIIKAGGPLKALYDERKAIDLPRCEAIAADPAQRARFAWAGRYAARAHAHNRAQRYVEKAFLRRLLSAWRKAGGDGSVVRRAEQPQNFTA